MPTVPRILQRSQNLVDLSIRTNRQYKGYRINSALTLDAAFAGGSPMFTVRAGTHFRSPGIRAKRWGRLQESTRGLTRVFYDPQDYVSATIPPEGDIAFLTVEEQLMDNTFLSPGPILVVPAPPFFTSHRPNLTLQGTAPDVSGASNLLPPPGVMHFVLPRYADSANITNTSANDLAIAFGPGLPEFVIPAGETRLLADGVIHDVFVRGDGGTASFSMYFALAIGAHE